MIFLDSDAVIAILREKTEMAAFMMENKARIISSWKGRVFIR